MVKILVVGTAIALRVVGVAAAGAWGAGAFDNDDASDWVDALVNQGNAELVYRALKQASEASYIEAPLGSAAVAAAEVVAALKGKPGRDLPTHLTTWLKTQHKIPTPEQVDLAVAVVQRVSRGPKSELQELWSESDAHAWQAAISDLLGRLGPRKSSNEPKSKAV